MKRVVISDIHIGSKYYKGEALIKFLQSVDYDQLILAGDIIDFIRVPQFSERALQIANSIDFSKEIIYIVGNHDTPLSGFIGHEAFGMKFVDKYEFEEGGRTFRIEHGDAYDDFSLIHNKIIMSFISVSQSCIEHWFDINLSDIYTNWKIKRRKLRRVWDILKRNSDADVFIMGHSHVPEGIIWVLPNQEIKTYINSGDWAGSKTYVDIVDGVVRLKTFEDEKMNSVLDSIINASDDELDIMHSEFVNKIKNNNYETIELITHIANYKTEPWINSLALEMLAGSKNQKIEKNVIRIIKKFLSSNEEDLVFSGVASSGFLTKEQRLEVAPLIKNKITDHPSDLNNAIDAFFRELSRL